MLPDKLHYKINPHSHVRIWFSDDKNVFLNPENQFRLVHLRTKNPIDTIHLVYAKSVLTPTAQNQLIQFCNIHNIIPLSIEEDIKPELISEIEHALMDLIEMEITETINGRGGNLASASDMTRWLKPIFRRGIYSDFDTEINTKDLPASISVENYILCSKTYAKAELPIIPQGYFVPILNNDIFTIAAVDENKPNHETAKALRDEGIAKAQQIIIDGYKQADLRFRNVYDSAIQTHSALFGESTAQQLAAADADAQVVKQLMSGKLGTTPFEMRETIEAIFNNVDKFIVNQLNILSQETPLLASTILECSTWDEAIKNKKEETTELFVELMLTLFKMGISLSSEFAAPFQELVDVYNDENKGRPEFILRIMNKNYMQMIMMVTKMISGPYVLLSIYGKSPVTQSQLEEKNEPGSWADYHLENNLYSKNNFDEITALAKNGAKNLEIGNICDVSWMKAGKEKIREREQVMENSAKRIQHCYRFYKRHHSKLVPDETPDNQIQAHISNRMK